jgi:hypothetical protein
VCLAGAWRKLQSLRCWGSGLLGKYFLLMAVNTAMTFARGLALAALLTVEDFGYYAIFMAVGMFASVLLGIGEVEATIKSFPRAAADGNTGIIAHTLRALNRKLSLRTAWALLLLVPCFYFFADDITLTVLFTLAVAVAMPAAQLGVYASAARAVPDLILLANSSLLRTVLALALCSAGAILAGAKGALLGEIAAAVIAIAYARTIFRQLNQSQGSESVLTLETATPRSSGLWLMAASLLASALLYLDRSFVALALGVEEAGRFGLLMIFVTGANALVGQVVQKVGPDLVKAQHAGAGVGQQMRILTPWLLGFAGAVAVLIGVGLGAEAVPWTAQFLEKFQIGGWEIVLTAALGLLQVSVLFDWVLISRNREKLVFASVCGFATALIIPAFLGFLLGLSLQAVLIIMIGARLAQVLTQCALILFYEGRSGGEANTDPKPVEQEGIR